MPQKITTTRTDPPPDDAPVDPVAPDMPPPGATTTTVEGVSDSPPVRIVTTDAAEAADVPPIEPAGPLASDVPRKERADCPHCSGTLIAHDDPGPKAGAWHCDTCGCCFVADGDKKSRRFVLRLDHPPCTAALV